ncbi:pyridoxamine 5'-phosphate oxidase family protein [Microbacterium sp. 2FI]|uniref:pyridoxamine 5'-phosphate oxidase family protein n=1 Tax=Microbacterium sp. 2FI TaxID=2502193 RepID=UPI0014851A5A|nr:pyridoxamine 5'-phosphate oxidase family protein [Microbacterium sp. 2FI]
MVGNDSPRTDDVENPYLVVPPASASEPTAKVEKLDTVRCWQLLEQTTLGRLAIEGHDGHPDVFPVNYLVHDGNLFLRSAPGSKMRSIVKHPAVAFEIDGETTNYHWSVVVHAQAHRMHLDAEIEASGVLDLVSSSPTPKGDFIRLIPESVTGRRFAKRPRPGRQGAPLVATDPGGPHVGSVVKPDPIPHFPPLRAD